MASPAPIQSASPSDDRPLHALLDEKAESTPHALAFRFLLDGESAEETLTYADLAKRSRALAAGITGHGAAGKPVLLIEPPGLGFIAGLFACWRSGAIAVPCYPPHGRRHRERLRAVMEDSGARHAIAAPGTSMPDGIELIDNGKQGESRGFHPPFMMRPDAPCLLQYTSGSTAAPKGVMISHRNFRSHFASLRCYDGLAIRSAVSWLPPYHDMGLVLKILYAFEAGIPLTFFSPDHFIQRPSRWLHAISRYRAELSGAPNFAFEACVRSIRDEELEGLDLSCWKAAPCGAERIRPETLDRFAKRFAPHGFNPEIFRPGYGLAETTLIVTACRAAPRVIHHPTAGTLVSNGPPLAGSSIRIVHPEHGTPLTEGEIGEIRVRGAVVSQGYWNQTSTAFDDAELKTGDLGFIDQGELFVTGRIKDLIIIDGSNHSPEDLEGIALTAIPEATAAAAFSLGHDGRESIALALEITTPEDRRHEICRRARCAIGDALEIPVQRVVIVRSGLLPRTTSGKIRRAACREALLAGTLRLLHDDVATEPTSPGDPQALAILLDSVAEITGRDGATAQDDIISLGMSSLDATRLAALLRARCGREVSLGDLFSSRSFDELSGILARRAESETGMPRLTPQSGENGSLTHAQERMWFLHQFDPSSAAYHVFGAIELEGQLDVDALRLAYQAVVSRHDILLSRHGSDAGRPLVRIERSVPELETATCVDETELRLALTCFARTPFDLATDAPIRTILFQLHNERHILAVCAHHIAADGWSMRLLAGQLAAAYAAAISEKPWTPPETGVSYLAYADTHRRWVDGGAVDGQIRYWNELLVSHPGVMPLPVDFPRPAKPSSDGSLVERVLPAALANRIAGIARTHRATPFMVHLAAFLLLLRQHGAGSDLIIAIPVANRNHADASELVGTLVNTLPFRLDVRADESFTELLERVRESSLEMQANQDAPFERIIDAIKPDRASGHAPLAQVMFDHQEIPVTARWAGGLECRPYIAHRGASQFDLSLFLTDFGDHQQLALEYRTDLFKAETITGMMDRHLTALESICENPGRKTGDITIPSPADLEWLGKVSEGPQRPHFLGRTTLFLIQNQAATHPDQTAIHADGSTATYGELMELSDRMAMTIAGRGILPGDRIAVLLERDVNLPAVLLAIWKAGAAYVPLDGLNPAARLRLILDDQSPIRVITSPRMQRQLPDSFPVILLDDFLTAEQKPARLPEIGPLDPAYVIYTSGSTGNPKGVVVSHGALANFLLSMAETPGFSGADKLLAVTTISFDISTLELFLPLVCGGSLEILSTETARDARGLLERLLLSGATVMQATPATWRMLLDAGWKGSPDLKILCGGEAMDAPLATELRTKGCQLWNLYGPTETTVWSTCWRVPDHPHGIRVGNPIANTGIHVLAEDGAMLPPGVPGHLWISGAGLAEGYWNQPQLTAEKFATITTAAGNRVRAYQTGDLARWHSDGSLECLGRSDGQIKIRGFRVELGEIETVITDHPDVALAKAALRGNHLVAWVRWKDARSAPATGVLKDFLTERLPHHMIPADIGVVTSFPLNPNGKVDVSQLIDPFTEIPRDVTASEDETRLMKIWSELLDNRAIHPDDNWFHIGGHSLLALRLFARIHQDSGINLPLSAILDHPTPRTLAAEISRNTQP